MFKNSDNDNDTYVGHTHSGRVFRGVHLKTLFKKNYEEEGFYIGEEENLADEEHSEPTRIEEREAKESLQDEQKTSGTTQTVEVSTINPPVI
jgi:hypothetical protein